MACGLTDTTALGEVEDPGEEGDGGTDRERELRETDEGDLVNKAREQRDIGLETLTETSGRRAGLKTEGWRALRPTSHAEEDLEHRGHG